MDSEEIRQELKLNIVVSGSYPVSGFGIIGYEAVGFNITEG
jgi:hypothetical protein